MGTTFRKAFFRPGLRNICICIFFLVVATLSTHMSFDHYLLCLEHSFSATMWLLLIPQLSANHPLPGEAFPGYKPKEGSPSPHFLSLSTLLFSFVQSRIVVTHFIGLLIQYLLPGCEPYGGQKPYLLCIPSRCLALGRCPKDIY